MEKGLALKAVLKKDKHLLQFELEELTNLCNTCDINIINNVTQLTDKINNNSYFGFGKLEEVKVLIENESYDVVVIDDELTPTQHRNMEEILSIKIIDRSMLILDIFRKRAKTNEAILEVKLAQLRYLLPRLSGLNEGLSKQGGFNTKGPGEKQIDLDRRKIYEEIYNIEQKLNNNRKTRMIQKQKRIKSNIPIVALVGYTNSGKSTTMNSFINKAKKNSDKLVYEKDQLFATLDTFVRKIKLANGFEFMLIDTVGFISKLPHHLVNSFHSTLSDILDADLILHVVDCSDVNFNKHIKTTNEVLESLGASSIDTLYLLNKSDKKCDILPIISNDYLYISNKTGYNFEELTKYITNHFIKEYYSEVELHMPYSESKLISYLEGYSIVKLKMYGSNFIYYHTNILNDKLKEYDDFIIKENDKSIT